MYSPALAVEKLSASGSVIQTINPPAGLSTFSPEIAADHTGDIYAGADVNNANIKLRSTGSVIDTIPVLAPHTDRNIAVSPANLLYLPDQINNKIDILGS
jgi:hypothetical protein